jgi:hypothetical protein
MPIDLDVDSNLEVYITGNGDLALADGRSRFENEVLIRLTERYYEHIGTSDTSTVKSILEQEATRVADIMDVLNEVAQITVEESDKIPNSFEVSIVYETGEEFQELIGNDN